jgi:hypothetical protein
MRDEAEQVCPAFWSPAFTRKGSARVEIGIGEDELRGLAAQLQRDRHDVLRRGLLHEAAGGDRAGEGDVADAGMRGRAPRRPPRRGPGRR